MLRRTPLATIHLRFSILALITAHNTIIILPHPPSLTQAIAITVFCTYWLLLTHIRLLLSH
jgi:hypothetical protein